MLKDQLISGIICEFNPLHLGHDTILKAMAAKGSVVCVMSGNFVQRGEPALMDKWSRTRQALSCGADLVLELPLPFATSRAETFALGGIGILKALNCVDQLWFGSESGDARKLDAIAELLFTPEYDALVKEKLKAGISFAAARETAVRSLRGKCYGEELQGANNALAVEYLKAIRSLRAPFSPRTIKRVGSAHDAVSQEAVVSAMQIRRIVHEGGAAWDYLPEATVQTLRQALEAGSCPSSVLRLETAILAKLRTMGPEDFAGCPDVSEGLENKLYKAVRTADSLEHLYDGIKSKRYSHARIRRLVLHAFLGVTAELQQLHYIRVLGMTKAGEAILKGTKKGLPLVGKTSDIKKLDAAAQRQFACEVLADDIYGLSLPKIQDCGSDFTNKMIKI